MKKAKKIAISIVGGVAAIGAAIAGKIMYDKSNEIPAQCDYGIFNTIEQISNDQYLNIEYGQISGSALKDVIQTIQQYNEKYPQKVEYIGPSVEEIVDDRNYEVSPEYDTNNNIESVMAVEFMEIIEETEIVE